MTDANHDSPDRVMIDLETLGREPGCAILSIGAVQFDVDSLGETFHRSISLESCDAAGLAIDAETLEWWLDQGPPQSSVLSGGDHLQHALAAFEAYYRSHDFDEIWAKSPSFDVSILEAAYNTVESTEPAWGYWETRDVRTALALVDVDVEREGDVHDALDDARYQARQVQEVLRKLDALESDLDMTAVAQELSDGAFEAATTSINEAARQMAAQLEREVRGAWMAGYDWLHVFDPVEMDEMAVRQYVWPSNTKRPPEPNDAIYRYSYDLRTDAAEVEAKRRLLEGNNDQ